MSQLSKKNADLTKVIDVVFSCKTMDHIAVAEKMYENWVKMYNDENTYVINLLNLKRKWNSKTERK